MMVDTSTLPQREPAAVIGVVVSVLSTIAAITAGQVTPLDGVNAISLAVCTFVVPLVQTYFIRRKVTPVATSPQTDAL